MPKKYHITTKATPLALECVSKFTITRGENCINCGKCTKVCIYEAHQRGQSDPRVMAEPDTSVCRNCFRCIQECPRGALVKSLDKDFLNLGGSYWKPDMFITLWKQAEDGKVPVSGAGYRGPFTGTGYDSMWTDMSEIVRPTRDGIHGREYISTSVDLGRKLNHLTFDPAGNLSSAVHDTVDLPIPIIFDLPAAELSANVKIAVSGAAEKVGSFAVFPAADIDQAIARYENNIIPLLREDEIDQYPALIKNARVIELDATDSSADDLPALQKKIRELSRALIAIRIPAKKGVESLAAALARGGAEIIHIAADYRGMEDGGSPDAPARLMKDVLRAVHLRLVEDRIRDELTIIASGGIAMAEHVPKSMICGADLTAIDMPLLIGLGARLYEDPEKLIVLPEGLAKIPAASLMQRIVNLTGAWHSQLLEVMGAMGIREARRLRGETGRAIFFEEIESETFGKLFRKREAASL
jgi:ferredoxin